MKATPGAGCRRARSGEGAADAVAVLAGGASKNADVPCWGRGAPVRKRNAEALRSRRRSPTECLGRRRRPLQKSACGKAALGALRSQRGIADVVLRTPAAPISEEPKKSTRPKREGRGATAHLRKPRGFAATRVGG